MPIPACRPLLFAGALTSLLGLSGSCGKQATDPLPAQPPRIASETTTGATDSPTPTGLQPIEQRSEDAPAVETVTEVGAPTPAPTLAKPKDVAVGTGQLGTIGHRSGSPMALAEGKMGKRDSSRYSGQYAPAKRTRGGRIARRAPARDLRMAAGADSGDSDGNAEEYTHYGVNPMTDTAEDHLSTFAIDVDTASYAIARRKIMEGAAPPPAGVRVEEFLNYFHYQYPSPTDGRPFAVHMDAAPSPYSPGRHLLRVGVQAKQLANSERKAAHLVFLVDVSGSMSSADKLELAKRALRILVDNLRDGDTVSLVTYAGAVRLVLEPTGLERKAEIVSAIEDLQPGGSTAMSSGIDLAYDMAARNLGPDSVSRVIVLSDGDANVGDTSHAKILKTIRGRVKEGVTLSTVGFGMGNYKDTMMEQLADQGNGNYYYIDGISQARRVFQEQLGGTLEVVAKDVKIQVDFNPAAVSRYRLVGYENRDIADVDFRNDRVDAGEIGAGHTVTALYEVELTRDQGLPLATVRVRAKAPRGETATETEYPFERGALHASFAAASDDFRWAVAVMGAAEILRGSGQAEGWTIDNVLTIAQAAGGDRTPERQEFVSLMNRARGVKFAAR